VLVLLLVLSAYSAYSWRTLSGIQDRSLELEVLRSEKAGKTRQLEALGERFKEVERKMAALREREKDLILLTRDYNRELGLPESTALEAVWPALTATVAWTWGGGEGQGGLAPRVAAAPSANLAPDEAVKVLHRDLDLLERNAAGVDLALNELISALKGSRRLLSATPNVLPMVGGRLTSTFGYRASPFGRGADLHEGVDFAAPIGTPIYAPADGTVLSSDWTSSGHGLMVTVDHGFGLVTRYAHLSESLVAPGQTVKRGEALAKVGSTGRSTGPHLHYETVLGGAAVDPMIFVQAPPGLLKASK
jgi:murein DD-endopeptidase MepM/ murein hydrolase activator NlpD